ncbi:hypothetical protein [Bacillus thermotolerans]|uniref:Uncharacterized protein n=1 Tax=Bacillus thermotolerans TaxID=1221996 RepID=A0A0F5HZ48_BACTR|nr:hypothetical protein [Bacillus thermotolerans]KKB36585.1 hypothetical protein QY96_03432 [Bacillus thermotolerans]KKB38335.1 hypothetical protein QY97_02868 [Bacillus thermotolerans]KKB39882.1 hypothetical protein QY95_02099 [Bacillus thermotolerans]
MIKRISTELLKVSSAAERPGLEKEMVQWLAASKGESILIAGILAGEWKKIINFL